MAPSRTVVTVERAEHVGTLWLDNPDRRNALGPAFWDELPDAMGELSDDDDVRAVVIAARGPAFTVGLDLKSMGGALTGAGNGSGTPRSDAAQRRAGLRSLKHMQAAITSVADCPKPVIAAVHGYCIGGGVDLITACDIRVASADAIFSVRETRIAIVADLGTLQRLPGVISRGHVAELAYTGKDIDADRAAAIGLVNHVLPDTDATHKAARELAAEIAANSPLAVQGTKAVLRAGASLTVQQGLDYVGVWNSAFLKSDDLTEAVTAFLEKRPANYRGA